MRDFLEVIDFFETFQHRRGLRARETIEAQIIVAALHVGGFEGLEELKLDDDAYPASWKGDHYSTPQAPVSGNGEKRNGKSGRAKATGAKRNGPKKGNGPDRSDSMASDPADPAVDTWT